MFTSFLTGGMQGLSSGIQVAGAMKSFSSSPPSQSPYGQGNPNYYNPNY